MEDLLSTEPPSSKIGTAGLRLSEGPLRHRDVPANQLLSWVSDTLHVAERAGTGTPEAQPLFWVRLYGLLADVADFIDLTVQDPPDGLCMFPLARGSREVSPLPLALARLRSQLDEDELLYIEYRRHLECDPFQSKYRRRGRHGTGHVPSALLGGRAVTIEHAEAAFARMFLRHGLVEDRIGIELARRLVPVLREIEHAARR